MLNDVMLDLETMGNGPDAAIVAIGAVTFDVHTHTIGGSFYMPVELRSAVQAGGAIDPDTVVWWLKQGDRARAAISGQGERMIDALDRFSTWMDRNCGPRADRRVWGNGAAFDNVILASAYRRLSEQQPWEHWNDRCYRTLKSMHRHVPMQRTGTHHNAVDDDESQARHLLAILASTGAAAPAVNYGGSA